MCATYFINTMTRSKSKVLKILKITAIKYEDLVIMKDLTNNCHRSHANKEIQEDKLECKDPNVQEMPKGNHTPPHFAYNILPETPESHISHREPSNSPYW